MKIDRFHSAATWGITMLVLALVGCGGAAREARQLGSLSILDATRPLDQNLVKRNEIDRASDASGVKTLLQFWLTLQRGEYQYATSYFGTAFLESVGVANLAAALRERAALWDSSKPKIDVATTRRHAARVYFNVRDLLGKVGAAAVVFERVDGRWRIGFFSLLAAAPS
jgi:hypothetical protein